MQTTQLLHDEYPLLVYPRLIKRFGLNTAVVLCFIYQMIEESGESCEDGYVWVRISVGEMWEELSFMSETTIKRSISYLRNCGVVVSNNKNESPYDRTNWYRLDYERLYSSLAEVGGDKNAASNE